jgi:hypothetical protein
VKTVIFTLILLAGVSTLWPADFAICNGSGAQRHPDIVFDGTRYTVVYDSAGEIWAAKVTTAGALQNKVNLSSDVANIDSVPSIAFSGSNCFVTWIKGNGSVYGVIIDLNNLPNTPFQIPFVNGISTPAVSYVSGKYLVTATAGVLIPSGSEHFLEGIIYNTDGSPATARFPIDNTPYDPGAESMIAHQTVTADNTKFIVVYPYKYADGSLSFINFALKYKFITTTGQVQPGGSLESVTFPYSGGPYRFDTLFWYPADLTYNGDNAEYFCAYHWPETDTSRRCNVYARRVSVATGQPVGSRVSIAAVTGRNECAAATTYECGHYITTWPDNRNTTYDLFGYYLDQSAVLLGNEITVTSASGNQINTQVAFDNLNNLAVWQDYRNSQWDIYGTFYPKAPSSNEAQALAYNGNRHFVRKPTANEFHLVYTDQGKIIYRYSYNGFDWPIQTVLGDGKWPVVAVDANNRAHVSWADNAGGLWFRYQTGTQTWSTTYHLYTPGSNPIINSPPAIALVSNRGVIYPHILVTRTGQGGGNVNHSVDDYIFPVTNPGSGSFEQLEYRSAAASPALRLNPTICKDDNDSLHAAWQRTDTIAYATRYRVSSWVVWSLPPMSGDGLESAQPYVEAYGNNIYIIWQKKYPTLEDAFYGYRPFGNNQFTRQNISTSSSTKSIYPTIANGFFKVYADELNSPWDIYYKVNPADDPVNISQTSTTSQYPQTCAKFDSPTARYIYTAWQENNASPYLIKTKKIQHQDPTFLAYLTSPNGQSQASPYNVSRDAYNGTGTVPVDIGYSSLSYRFRLLPGYYYQIKTTAYQNQSGTWKETVKLDNGNPLLIQYGPNMPQLIEAWIPSILYEDTVVDLTIGKVSGSYAVLGPIEIYQYELDPYQGGGPQSIKTSSYPNGLSLLVNPTMVKNSCSIEYTLTHTADITLSLYDASGRWIDNIMTGNVKSGNHKRILTTEKLPPGVYFLHLKTNTADIVQKLIILR